MSSTIETRRTVIKVLSRCVCVKHTGSAPFVSVSAETSAKASRLVVTGVVPLTRLDNTPESLACVLVCSRVKSDCFDSADIALSVYTTELPLRLPVSSTSSLLWLAVPTRFSRQSISTDATRFFGSSWLIGSEYLSNDTPIECNVVVWCGVVWCGVVVSA